MWIWISIAAVLILAAWLLVWLIGLPIWIAILVTVVAVLGVAVVFLIKLLRARARAAALERELLKQAGTQAEQARPERRMEILQLQAQMRQAIQALKKSRLGAGGGSALYALPWYVIVGPPAAGKTTALEQSGLAFTSPGPSGPKIRGTAGTRNCDWWFSQHAILLDTAGRFTTEDDDRDEWFAFLDTVKRFRPGKPLDGILVAVSVTDLIGADESHIEDLAQKLRARVDEMMTRLEMVLPIYVVFTKLDLVAGFVEFWGDANKQQRAQAWGATFRLNDERLKEPGRAMEAEFDILLKSLHSRLLDRLPRERLSEARTRILQFPAEFQLLRAPLARFVEELCTSNPYQESPILRGFYFTSGTQVGRPLDHVLANMVRGFNLRVGVGQEPGRAQPQSYFVTDLFKGIVFLDRNIAERSGTHQRRQLIWQLAVGGAAALVTTVVLVWAALSYADHSDLVAGTTTAIDNLKKAEKAQTGRFDTAHLEALTNLYGQVQRLREERDRVRLPGWLNSASLYEPTYAYYIDRMRFIMDGPVRDQLRAEVGSITGLAQLTAENFGYAYNDLKLYGMMTGPEHLNGDWAKEHLAEQWIKAGTLAPRLDADKVGLNVQEYLQALAANHALRWRQDEAAIASSRRRICQQPIEELQFATLAAFAKGVPPVRPEKIFYGVSAPYLQTRGDVEVPGLFTKPGWNKVREALQKPEGLFTLEPWVCGGATVATPDLQKSSVEHLRTMYFDRYENAWTSFFRGLSIQSPSDIRTSIDELRALEQADGPYTRLFQTLTENATLEMDVGLLERGINFVRSAVDAGTTEKPISPVEKHFKPLISFSASSGNGPPAELTTYLSLLTNLEVSLSQLAESRDPAAGYDAELTRTKNAVERLFGRLEAGLRGLIKPLLMAPIMGARGAVVRAGEGDIATSWKADVWDNWNAKLAGKYPFTESQNDASLTDFVEFFRPVGGFIWKYYESTLSKSLQRNGNSFTVRDGIQTQYRPELIRCLNIAAEITDAVFGASPEPGAAFFIKMQPAGRDIAEIIFQIDGQPKVYRNEPEKWIPVVWPAKDAPARGGVLKVRGAGFEEEIARAGDFGLFRLFDAGALKPLTATDGVPVLAATWMLSRSGTTPVVIQVRPSKGIHPFERGFFRKLKCPETATAAGIPPPSPGGFPLP
jgi:type VI secretion system protein ImpL